MQRRPSVQHVAGPRAVAFVVLAIAASCAKAPPRPPPPEDADMTYPPRCDADGMQRCEVACETGEQGACLWVAHGLELAGRSPGRVRKLMERSCEAGYARACGHLGLALLDADPKRSATLLRGACEQGHGRACVWLVARHVLAKTPLDWAAAAPWLERGCAADDALACVGIGDLARTGRGVPADPQRARERRHRACELGRSSACDDEASGEPHLHALFSPDPPLRELSDRLDADATDVRVRYCVQPDGVVRVRKVEPAGSSAGKLCREVVGTWRFLPTGRAAPACTEVVFAIRAG
jgi:hypothetical protein